MTINLKKKKKRQLLQNKLNIINKNKTLFYILYIIIFIKILIKKNLYITSYEINFKLF